MEKPGGLPSMGLHRVGHANKLWKILKEMGIPDNITCLLGSLYAGQKATELDMEERTGSKLGKEYIRLYIVTLLI